MTRINTSADVIARIQAQLRSAEPLRGIATKTAGGRARQQPALPGDFTSTVVQRVRLIEADDPDRERKAFRIFLEAALLGELGAGLAEDPRFQEMLDHVQSQFDSDPELARAASQAARHLLGANRQP